MIYNPDLDDSPIKVDIGVDDGSAAHVLEREVGGWVVVTSHTDVTEHAVRLRVAETVAVSSRVLDTGLVEPSESLTHAAKIHIRKLKVLLFKIQKDEWKEKDCPVQIKKRNKLF